MMTTLLILTSLFLVLEVLNVALLMFDPGSHRGNALGVFRAWETSKQDPEVHALVRYLAAWVAASKTIFIVVIAALLVLGDDRSRVIAVGALTVSVLAYFWKLRPQLRSMEDNGWLNRDGFTRRLSTGIVGIAVVLAIGFASGWASL